MATHSGKDPQTGEVGWHRLTVANLKSVTMDRNYFLSRLGAIVSFTAM
jgi:hypothetical protein